MHARHYFLLVVLGGTIAAAAAQPPSQVPKLKQPDRFVYHDDHDRRRLADIRLQVVDLDGTPSLRLTIAAVGTQVDAIPGFPGVRGGNRHTAEQLENILSGRFPFAVTTQADGSAAPWIGQWRAGRYGPLPQRRLGADGRLDFLAMTPRDYPLELIVDTGNLRAGKQTTELWFDGQTRLRVKYEVAGNQARITGFESLAAPKDNVHFAQPADPNVNEKPWQPPLAEDDWQARDLEGKWRLYLKLVAGDERKAKGFVHFLAQRKEPREYELLEMIALSRPLYEGGSAAAWALALADAPQWLRTAAWQRTFEVDHGESESQKLLLKHDPPKALAWLSKYYPLPKDADPTQRPSPLHADLAALLKKNVKPGTLGLALPPHDPAVVFRLLDAPAALADFGDRKRAEPGKVYEHQVLRTIDGFVQSGKYREPWLDKIHVLTRHAQPRVRQAAYLSYSYFAYAFDGKNSPADEFLKVADDPREQAALREAALMAFSYFRNPKVYVRLHELFMETTHPAWGAAVSRLGDIGNEYTVLHLARVDKTRLSAKDAALLDRTAGDFKRWLDDPQRARDESFETTLALLERAAWAEASNSPTKATLVPWTKGHLTTQPKGALDPQLDKMRSYERPTFAVPDADAFAKTVRGLAKDISSARQ